MLRVQDHTGGRDEGLGRVEQRGDRPPTDVFGQRNRVVPGRVRSRRRDCLREASLDGHQHLLGGHPFLPQAVHELPDADLDTESVMRCCLAGGTQTLEDGGPPDGIGCFTRLPDRRTSALEAFPRALEQLERPSELRGECSVSIVAGDRAVQTRASRHYRGDIAVWVTLLVRGRHRRTDRWGTGALPCKMQQDDGQTRNWDRLSAGDHGPGFG